MAEILVAGHVGVDRVWRLDRRLRTGERLRCLERTLRIGGGAANTGAALAVQGHRPVIAARLATDRTGEDLLQTLIRGGLDTRGVERVPGATVPGEILLDPDGERTLIGGPARLRVLPAGLAAMPGPIVYLNFAALAAPETLRGLLTRPWVVAQMPLATAEARPAHVLIASRSDVGAVPAAALWAQRRQLDGEALRFLVVTDGPRGVERADATGVRHFPGLPPVAGDTIGAGDFFAAGLLDALAHGVAPDQAVQHAQHTAARLLEKRPEMLRVLAEP